MRMTPHGANITEKPVIIVLKRGFEPTYSDYDDIDDIDNKRQLAFVEGSDVFECRDLIEIKPIIERCWGVHLSFTHVFLVARPIFVWSHLPYDLQIQD